MLQRGDGQGDYETIMVPLNLDRASCTFIKIIATLLEQMKEAARIYSKYRREDRKSSVFQSSVEREGVQDPKRTRQAPGPGSYQVTLPLVRPKYETIIKKHRAIIIKINEVNSPGFNSREPRFFGQYSTIQNDQQPHQSPENKQEQLIKPKNAYRYNFSLAKKESIANYPHFLHIGEGHDKNQMKGKNWSKYKERRIWSEAPHNLSAVGPGPGTYETSNSPSKVKRFSGDQNSWQFRSETIKIPNPRSKSFNFRLDAQRSESEDKFGTLHSRKNLFEPEDQ